MLILNSGRLQIRLNNSRVPVLQSPVLLDLQPSARCHSSNPEGSNIRICNPQKTPLKKNTNKSELRTQNIYKFTPNFLTQTLI